MLQQIFKKYNCDKNDHLYHEVYEKYLEGKTQQPLNVLEIGIFKGVSLDSWHEYLPNANIYGLDIFTRLTPEEIPALKKDRIKWLKADSTDSSVSNIIKQHWGDIKFDIIIDDGLHTPEANAKTFTNLVEFLKDEGSFFIEDVWPLDVMTYDQWNHTWMKKNRTKYNMEKWKIFANAISSYQATQYDLREASNIPDSYIYEIRK